MALDQRLGDGASSTPRKSGATAPTDDTALRPPEEIDTPVAAGYRELEEDIRAGALVYLVVGVPDAGKTQLLDAHRRIRARLGIADPASAAIQRKKDGKVAGTAPDVLIANRVGRDCLFLDAAGERYRHLYPDPTVGARNPLDDNEHLSLVAKHLGGVLLLVDLTRMWPDAVAEDSMGKRQVELLSWALRILRWLRFGGVYPDDADSAFHAYVEREVLKLDRLDVPVQVLFSKADLLLEQPIPAPLGSWTGHTMAPKRTLYPVGESPLFFAMHSLPELHSSLKHHTSHFRYDFAHSVVEDRESGKLDPSQVPCGVLLALEWLSDPAWRVKGRLPTRFWLTAQRWLDALSPLRQRWRSLPKPEQL